MAQWSPWDTPRPAASPFDSKKVHASFEKYSSFPDSDKPATVSWYHDSDPLNDHTVGNFSSNNRAVKPSEVSPSTSDSTDATQTDFLTRYSQLKELEKYKNEMIEVVVA